MNSNTITLKRDIKWDYYYSEALKSLRTNIQFCGSGIQTVMFTSALPDEGKSDVMFGLAITMAQIGKKVIVIDADIRKSVLVQRYNIEGAVSGLTQYLVGQKSVDEIIYRVEKEGLSVIFAGQYSPNPAELLEEELFDKLIDSLKKEYDYIFIDTPPMAAVADGAIVAKRCDGVVLVIESGTISYRLEQRVHQQIAATGTRLLGAVLNKVDKNNEGYYGKYGKYG